MIADPELKLPKADAVADIVAQQGVPARAKLSQWVRRYGLAEVVGIVGALVASAVVRRATGNAIAAAYGAAWGETVGYTAVIVAQDLLAESRASRQKHRMLGWRDLGELATGLLSEFGPAGLLDTLLVRPATMALGTRLVGPHAGVIAGKLAADVLFYIPVIYMYERRKRRRRHDS